MTPIVLALWACGLAISWLLPNHYYPWPAFHADAWCAAVMLCGSAATAVRLQSRLVWYVSDAFIIALLFVPALQYAFGLIFFGGQAAVVSAYILGFLLAALTGSRWDKEYPDQAVAVLFLAIGIAAILSVNLQFRTWLGQAEVGMFDVWSMGLNGSRPYANLGQPNQLATLLLWGILASAWAFQTKRIGGGASVVMAVFLLTGVALTQSRTAWLGLLFITLCSWHWRSMWRSQRAHWVASGLFVYFWACHWGLQLIGSVLGLGVESGYVRGDFQGDLRIPAWKIFFSAASERPWFGYGWSEVGKAQLEVAQNFPTLFPVFGHAHNIVLDLVLWLGLPLGLLASFSAVAWYVKRFRSVSHATDAVLIMLLGVVGIHAMLEFPLHYAYFLFPCGLVVGVLNQRSTGMRYWTTPRWTMAVLLLAGALLMAGIGRDYFRVESSFRDARFEAARIGTLPIGQSPEILLLTHLKREIDFMRIDVNNGMTSTELDWLEAVANSYPSGGRSYKVAKALVLNGRPLEGIEWLRKICKISSEEECALIRRVWKRDSETSSLQAAVPWPSAQQ